jgi:hypothetical protein
MRDSILSSVLSPALRAGASVPAPLRPMLVLSRVEGTLAPDASAGVPTTSPRLILRRNSGQASKETSLSAQRSSGEGEACHGLDGLDGFFRSLIREICEIRGIHPVSASRRPALPPSSRCTPSGYVRGAAQRSAEVVSGRWWTAPGWPALPGRSRLRDCVAAGSG